MTEDLERRLSQLSTWPVDEPALTAIVARARLQRRRRAAGLGAVAATILTATVLAGLTWNDTPTVQIRAEQGADETSTSEPGSPSSSTTGPSTLEGYQPVSGSNGTIVGFIADADLARAIDEGEPVLDLGTGAHPLRGFVVVDAEKQVVGYFLSGDAGFVPADVLDDPAVADEYGAQQERESDQPISPELQAMIDDLEAQSSGGG